MLGPSGLHWLFFSSVLTRYVDYRRSFTKYSFQSIRIAKRAAYERVAISNGTCPSISLNIWQLQRNIYIYIYMNLPGIAVNGDFRRLNWHLNTIQRVPSPPYLTKTIMRFLTILSGCAIFGSSKSDLPSFLELVFIDLVTSYQRLLFCCTLNYCRWLQSSALWAKW